MRKHELLQHLYSMLHMNALTHKALVVEFVDTPCRKTLLYSNWKFHYARKAHPALPHVLLLPSASKTSDWRSKTAITASVDSKGYQHEIQLRA